MRRILLCVPAALFIMIAFQFDRKTMPVKPIDQGNGIFSLVIFNLKFEIDVKSAGRISSFKLNDKEFLSGKQINPDNWGSTFWPSPQSAWGWPPSEELDKEAYTGGIVENAVVLTSEQDSKLGYVVKKEFSGNTIDTAITIRYTIINNSEKTQSVSPWEITRVPPGGLTFFPAGKGERKGKLAPLMTVSNGMIWFPYNKDLIPAGHEKLMCDGKEGWMAQVSNDMVFIKKWTDVPMDKNAPGEGEVEIYANPDKSYIEIEPQGPYTSLMPKASLVWEVKWYLRSLPKGMKAQVGNEEIIDFVRRVIK
jgi:hypothetical protein